jgi:hypothetical protein
MLAWQRSIPLSIKVTKDGRTIRTGKDYTLFRLRLWKSQLGYCAGCGGKTDYYADLEADWSFHVDHTNGRAAGKRDDTPESCKGKCGKCHRIKHNQQSTVPSELHWSRK